MSSGLSSRFFALYVILGAVTGIFFSCNYLQPEVVIVNNTAEHILIKNPRFNGTTWNTVLAYGEATSPRRCLDGPGKVHFQKFNAFQYCREQQEDGTIDSLCPCNTAHLAIDSGLINTTPYFFNYQTLSAIDAVGNDYFVIELKLDDMEQDFSVPGPYGH